MAVVVFFLPLSKTAVGLHGVPCQDHNLHLNHWTDYLRRNKDEEEAEAEGGGEKKKK